MLLPKSLSSVNKNRLVPDRTGRVYSWGLYHTDWKSDSGFTVVPPGMIVGLYCHTYPHLRLTPAENPGNEMSQSQLDVAVGVSADVDAPGLIVASYTDVQAIAS